LIITKNFLCGWDKKACELQSMHWKKGGGNVEKYTSHLSQIVVPGCW
jgi:hypothetical protein